MANYSYLTFGCSDPSTGCCDVELTNACRTAAYIEAGLTAGISAKGCGCPGEKFYCSVGDSAPYSTPEADFAPWYDAAVPASADFAGFLVLDVTGLDAAQADVNLTERSGDGAILGRKRLKHRELLVRGVLLGRTCCATTYGLHWLTEQLQGCASRDCNSCKGSDLTYLDCIPCLPIDPAPCIGTELDAEWRTLHDVVLMSGPEVLQKVGGHSGGCSASCVETNSGCCTAIEVQFTLAAGDPFAYHCPIEVCSTSLLSCEDEDVCDFTWCIQPDDPVENACHILLPPAPPPTQINTCEACIPFNFAQTCCIVEPQTGSSGGEVFISEITAGSTDLHNVIVYFVSNSAGLPSTSLSLANACGGFGIASLPAHHTLTIDASRKTVMLSTGPDDNMPIEASDLVNGLEGGFRFQAMGCPDTRISICVMYECETAGIDAEAKFSVVGRDR